MTPQRANEPEPTVLADVAAWRAWLDANEDTSDGLWLLLAKKGTDSPTSLSYAAALDEALCSGWIDGQRKRYDELCFRQRFTPRRQRSIWSARNVEHVQRLIGQGRMRPRGQHEIDRAKADGRWERAYPGPATATVPEDLTEALAARPGAQQAFESLNGQNRYAVLHRLMAAPNQATRQRRLDTLLGMLDRGEKPYPQ